MESRHEPYSLTAVPAVDVFESELKTRMSCIRVTVAKFRAHSCIPIDVIDQEIGPEINGLF